MVPDIKIVPLGAGQDVGRSCILVSIGGRNVMLDCGMHMGYQDERRFPDFSYIGGGGNLNDYLDCVIISHFHLDHCGSLPHMSEIVGFDGPIFMTHPTKAIAPVLLEDYRKVQTEFRGDTNFFTSAHIKACMKKVVALNLHETYEVDSELSIRAFYAGHVLGAAMFEVRVGSQSVLYTGDYNMTPDRHLGAARVLPGLKPDVLISESTYATTIRDSKRARERDFLKKIHDRVQSGGKVLIPVFALGRAQELCILLESYWERMDLKVPIYFSQGLAERANQYYRLFINWTNEKIKHTFVERNMFDFTHIKPMEKNYEDLPGAMVLFSTPGMLHGGQSLKVFKKWCGDSKNMIIMPGFCVAGTVGAKVIGGMKKIEIENKMYEINLGVEYMSFSAHADAKGIMQLIRDCSPRSVMFVHGEAAKMEFLKEKVIKEFNLPVYMPANGETVSIPGIASVDIDVPWDIIQRSIELDPTPAKKHCPFSACLLVDKQTGPEVVTCESAAKKLNLPLHYISFSHTIPCKKSLQWEKMLEKLMVLDHKAQLKQDGIEMFHGEVAIMRVSKNRAEIELIWDECREAWQPQILSIIEETMNMIGGRLVTEYLPYEDVVPLLEPGDLIEFQRTVNITGYESAIYNHWALYIGYIENEYRVIHISGTDGDFIRLSGENRVKDSLLVMTKLSGGSDAAVRCDKLSEVSSNDKIRINNSLDETHRAFPSPIIIERATHKLGERNYNVVFNNCEHFVKWCRYGNRISSQAVMAKSMILSSVLALGVNPVMAVGVGIAFAATSHKLSRFMNRTFGSRRSFSLF